MSDELMESIIDQVSRWQHRFFFSPFKVNEPLMDKRVLPYMKQINERVPHAVLRLFTNGSTLTPSNREGIAKLKRVAHLWVSLNSTDEVEYRDLMKIDFFHTAQKLDFLHDEVRHKEFKHVVILSRVVQGNELDVQFIKYCKTRWPSFVVQMIKKDGWLGYTDPQMKKVPQIPCARWWELSIMSTGIAALCCMDGTGQYSVGNVNDTSLLDIYNQPGLLKMRQGLIDRSNVSPCNRCTY